MKILSSTRLSAIMLLVGSMMSTSCLSRFSETMKSPCTDAGPDVKYEKPLSGPVSALNAGMGLDVTYIQQPGEPKILVEGPENLIKYVTYELKGQKLSVALSKPLNNCASSLKITVSAPKITGFSAYSGAELSIAGVLEAAGEAVSAEASSGASFSAGKINAAKVTLSTSSGASVSAANTIAETVEAISSSGSSLAVGGKCTIAKLSSSSGSSLSASKLIAETGTVAASSGSSLSYNIANPQSATASSGGSISKN